ncbi:MAG TPA: MarR family winged helix-turn-helix transcriptional regulator [Dongiaceae bacterium]|nr:MarR family winged helix-turn-helix transcriptional regulator [Dongiaceae bacterium]
MTSKRRRDDSAAPTTPVKAKGAGNKARLAAAKAVGAAKRGDTVLAATQLISKRSTARQDKPLAELLGEQRVAGLRINLESMALVSNIHRGAGFIREHFERSILAEAELHWSAFVTLWCLWIYGELETRRLALEAGVAKSTLSSILNMLEGRKLVRRRTNELERRLVIVNLTASGAELISTLFPKFNAEETRITARLSPKQIAAATEAIRIILATITDIDGPLD